MTGRLLVITNRGFRRDRSSGRYRLLDELNSHGSRELRLFWATPRGGDASDWDLAPLPDRVTRRDFQAESLEPALRKPRYNGSDLAAAQILDRLQRHRRNLLLFVHGYNNNATDALRRAWRLAERYELEVVVFSWPANGGGRRLLEDLHGVASYRSDKSDARASTEALDRALGRMQLLMQELNSAVLPALEKEARATHPTDVDARRALLARLLQERACPFNVTLLAHSMGNYLYKKMLMSSGERLSRDMTFDNVILKAADTNHAGHAEWVERIRARRRVYVTINQEDEALRLSTMKLGDAQRPRLGNTLAAQDAANATYVDCTPAVGTAHSYFDESDLETAGGGTLGAFMAAALNGRIADEGLPYRPDMNVYRLAP